MKGPRRELKGLKIQATPTTSVSKPGIQKRSKAGISKAGIQKKPEASLSKGGIQKKSKAGISKAGMQKKPKAAISKAGIQKKPEASLSKAEIQKKSKAGISKAGIQMEPEGSISKAVMEANISKAGVQKEPEASTSKGGIQNKSITNAGTFCKCCLNYGHEFYKCPYKLSVKEDAEIGPGWVKVCHCCWKKNAHPGNKKVRKIAIQWFCGRCYSYDHLPEDCHIPRVPGTGFRKKPGFPICL